MQSNQPERRTRRTQPQQTAPAVRYRKKKRRVVNALVCIALVAIVALIVLASPKEPTRRAYYSVGTQDNLNATGGHLYDYTGLVISEVMASNQTAMPDENGKYPDWLEIWNSADHDMNLKDVGLSDNDTSIKFLFPDMVLAAGERVVVLCDKTNQAIAGKPLHAKFGLSSNGESLYLYDPNAYLIDSVKTPILGADESYARLADGTWGQTKEFSPGYENTTAGHQAYRSATLVTEGALIINEVCPSPLTGYTDASGNVCDWVELYNTTDQVISLDNYALSDKEGKPLKWRFPAGATVAPHGYYLVYCNGDSSANTDPTAVPHANFRLSAEHDNVILSDSRGRLVDRVTLDNVPDDASYARNENGIFIITQTPTPGLPNTQEGANRMDYILRSLNPTGVYITEVMASNDTAVMSSAGDYADWVEIYNSSSQVVDLSGYGLSDNIGRARKWQFPEGTYISPGEYKIIWCDGNVALNNTAEPHTSFKLKKSGGEVLVLADPTGKILDKVVLPEIPTNVSYGRSIGREGFFYYETATAGSQNGTDTFLGYAEAPEFVLQPGKHKGTVVTGFTIPKNTTVYYTTDGSVPTMEKGYLYTGQEILFSHTTTLRARAFPANAQYKASTVITGTYLVETYYTTPVVCITVDPEELWNEETGMLAAGPDIDKSGGIPFKNTVYRQYGKTMREGYLEYYDLDGTQLLSQGVAIGLIGNYSLDMPQKSMKIRAKSLYGEKTFAAALFDDRPFTEYKSLVVRNSGNDAMSTRLLDGFQSRLLDAYGASVIHQAWKPVSVFLNGQYWGHMNLRERVDRFFVAQHEGLPLDQADEMDILEANGSVYFGSNKEYRAMLKKIKAGSPATNPEDLQYILDNVDVDNLFEYMALEMFVGNSDIGNIRYYRLHQEGSKWKWIWYDADYGLYSSSFNSPWSYMKTQGMGEQKIDNTIFLKLLEHPDYRQKFLEKLADVYKTFTTEYMTEILDGVLAEIEPEMKNHWTRWGELNDKAITSEVPVGIDSAYTYWESRVNRLYNTLKLRPHRLWDFIKEEYDLTQSEMEALFGPQPDYPEDAIL